MGLETRGKIDLDALYIVLFVFSGVLICVVEVMLRLS